MIEYQLFEGNVIELLSSKAGHSEESCTKICSFVYTDCPVCQDKEDHQLLDIDYYPLALKIAPVPDPRVFLKSIRFYLPIVKDAASLTFLSNPPLPRLS